MRPSEIRAPPIDHPLRSVVEFTVNPSDGSTAAWPEAIAPSHDDVSILGVLRSAITEAGSQGKFAKACGVSAPLINQIVAGKRPISDRILEHLGYEKVISYRKIERP